MKKTVLIVDDSIPMRFLLESFVGKKYKVFSAMDGLTAMMWLAKGNVPDIIVTDIQMPGMDGWELIKYLSGNVLYDDIPVIVLSGSRIEDAPVELRMKMTEFVSKPFDPIKLVDLVDKHVEMPKLTVQQ
ncbi:MAG TPA: response regulator [Chitinophaga sp.]